jgi:hypothetical protein
MRSNDCREALSAPAGIIAFLGNSTVLNTECGFRTMLAGKGLLLGAKPPRRLELETDLDGRSNVKRK